MSSSKNQNKRQMPSYLLDLLDNDVDKTHHKEYYYAESTRALRKLLVQYLKNRIQKSAVYSDKSIHYDKPAWAEFQAAQAGAREEDRHLIDLLDR